MFDFDFDSVEPTPAELSEISRLEQDKLGEAEFGQWLESAGNGGACSCGSPLLPGECGECDVCRTIRTTI